MKKLLLSLLEPLDRILWNWMCVNRFILFQRGRKGWKGASKNPNNIPKNFSSRSNTKRAGTIRVGKTNKTKPSDTTQGEINKPKTRNQGEGPKIYREDSNAVRILYYPTTLPENTNRPQIKFSCIDRKSQQNRTVFTDRSEIYFPCPGNITFADQANYNTLDLGVIGAAVLGEDRLTREGPAGNANAIGNAIKKISDGTMSKVGAGKIVELTNFKNRVVANPFQNTAFTGNQIRNFTFNFKMIAKNQADADNINRIHRTFREKSYAQKSMGNAVYLKYPPIWEIDFLQGYDNTGFIKNRYVPEINLCYLTAVNTTFNTTAPAWASTGSPIEVDVSLTFQETRANERDDIISMGDFEGIGDTQGARQYNRKTGKVTNYYGPRQSNTN